MASISYARQFVKSSGRRGMCSYAAKINARRPVPGTCTTAWHFFGTILERLGCILGTYLQWAQFFCTWASTAFRAQSRQAFFQRNSSAYPQPGCVEGLIAFAVPTGPASLPYPVAGPGGISYCLFGGPSARAQAEGFARAAKSIL